MSENGVLAKMQLAEGLPHILGDKVQLQQVILNLIMNATEAMSELREGSRELLISTSAAESDGVLVAVSDPGPGLPQANAGRIFEAFYTTKASGLGMSPIAQMEELLAERNPLYGRNTLAREILPMSLRDAAEFVPQWEPADANSLFSVLGGAPYYLDLRDQSQTLAENIKRLFLAPSASLQEEPAFLLRSELNEVRRYASIAAAIADGATKPSEIAPVSTD
jgi:uncharacterized protein